MHPKKGHYFLRGNFVASMGLHVDTGATIHLLGQYPSERFYNGELQTAPSVVRKAMEREHESIM